MADAHKNFAYSLVATAPSPAPSGTSLVVTAGQGALFPAVPFNAVIWPAGVAPISTNAEVVRVTAIATDTLTITRAQEGSSARTVIVGDQIAASITAKTLTDVEALLGSVNIQVFTATGTYTPTAGMKYCIVELVGSGGGGGGATGSPAGAGGGGGGGYSREMFTAAEIGASKAVTIGAAGTAGTTGAGGTGGTVDFGSLMSATGGLGGGGGATGFNPGGAGGGGLTGDFNTVGEPGGNGIAVPTDSVFSGGHGGSSMLGGGAIGRTTDGVGVTATGYGGGGGGGMATTATDRAGGAGMAGVIIVTEYL